MGKGLGGFLDRYTKKVEQYWEDNYETTPKASELKEMTPEKVWPHEKEEEEEDKPTLPKEEKNSPETSKKKPRKAKKD